ncbi:hypothetical protein RHGRI_002424 [Rhododendron griersonianum]|uniref:Caleosin n=1 Tax=Rhododendron griersonianum TaxID=479676 RepID=A0AAV6LPJ9_9ERIC|nr:hypothetical protein RHGRI_002424 [Rhododendron griersonianum]
MDEVQKYSTSSTPTATAGSPSPSSGPSLETSAVTVIDKDGAIDLHEFADFHRGNASTHGGQNRLFKGNN